MNRVEGDRDSDRFLGTRILHAKGFPTEFKTNRLRALEVLQHQNERFSSRNNEIGIEKHPTWRDVTDESDVLCLGRRCQGNPDW
ncbi:MAG TPA: hypothetical protein VF011_20430 [Terriglobales bacterium]